MGDNRTVVVCDMLRQCDASVVEEVRELIEKRQDERQRWDANHNTVTFNIGDGLSYLMFISELRHKLFTRSQDCKEDIKKLAHSTQKQPLLRLQLGNVSTIGINRWLLVELVACEEDGSPTTTLAMRDDNLYIYAFRNKDGTWYELLEEPNSCGVLPDDGEFRGNKERTEFGTSYGKLLGIDYDKRLKPDQSKRKYRHEVAKKLSDIFKGKSGKDTMVEAVKFLSAYGNQPRHNSRYLMSIRNAIAALIVLVAESARMNPFHDFFACRWNDENNGRYLPYKLIRHHTWSYGAKSSNLRDWENQNHQTKEKFYLNLVDTCLVLNKCET